MAETTTEKRGRGDRFGWREGDLVSTRDRRRRQSGERKTAEVLALAGLRRGRGVTQVELAERLGSSQGEISKLEQRSDVKLSTVLRYLEGLGAREAMLRVDFAGGRELVRLFPRVRSSGPPEGDRRRKLKTIDFSLAAIRKGRKMTQVELAERSGIPQDQISKLERRNDVKLSTVLRYLEGLGATDAGVGIVFDDGSQRGGRLPL